jgi:large subunit ribosomal protein L1
MAMTRLSKRKKEFGKIIDNKTSFSLDEAIGRIEKFPKTKFDESVELHFHLNLNVKNTDQSLRGTALLPHGTGKKVRIAVFCKGEQVQKAEAAGADYAGGNELIDRVANGFMDFDSVVATPDMMRDLSRLGKLLGPRGLMPSPKAGTVTTDIEKVIKELKAGRVEFKSDKQAGMHITIGKRSFKKEQLVENAKYLMESVEHLKPSAVKGNLIKSLFLSTTMGPGLRISI